MQHIKFPFLMIVLAISFAACNETMPRDSRVDKHPTDNKDKNGEWWADKTFTATDEDSYALIRYYVIQAKADTTWMATVFLQKGQRIWLDDVTKNSATLHMVGDEYDFNLINGNNIVSNPEIKPDTRSDSDGMIKTPSPLVEDTEIPLITNGINKDGNKLLIGVCKTIWGAADVLLEIYPSKIEINFYMTPPSTFTRDDGYFSMWSSVNIGGDNYLSSPFAAEWNPSIWPDDVKISPSEFIQGILNIKCLEASRYGFSFVTPEYISLSTLFQRYFSALTLREFPMLNTTTLGKRITYGDDTPQYYIDFDDNPGILYYKMLDANKIKLYINPQDLVDRTILPYIRFFERDIDELILPKDNTDKLADLIRVVLSSAFINGNGLECQLCEGSDKYGYSIVDLFCTDLQATSELLRGLIDFIMFDSENAPNFNRVLKNSIPYKNFRDDFLKIKDILPELLNDTQSLKLGLHLYKNPYGKWHFQERADQNKYPLLHLYDDLWGISDSLGN